MFDVYCPECDSKRLIFPSDVTGIDNVGGSIVVHFTCWCGAAGLWRTGQGAPSEAVAWPAGALAS